MQGLVVFTQKEASARQISDSAALISLFQHTFARKVRENLRQTFRLECIISPPQM
jgi:hypothetical protein